MLKRKHRGRKGGIYVVTLGATLLVTVIGATALLAARVKHRSIHDEQDSAAAYLYALSAIEMGRYWIASDSSWRSSRSNGAWATNRAIGSGTFSLDVQNPNGALNNSNSDPVILTGTGIKGLAQHKISVKLQPQGGGVLNCLNVAAAIGSNITFQGSSVVQATGQTVASNAAMTASSCTVNANVEAVTTISGSTYNGTKSPGATPRTLPDASVFTWYQANGTAIPITSLTLSGSNRLISQKLLSPASNPFTGLLNSQGIYVIDCQGQTVLIQNSRIVGTLVLINPASTSAVQSSVNWVPAVTNYPCLLVQGNFGVKFSTNALTEASTNFNPVGTPYPYPSGSTNATNSAGETYPSTVKGMIYISGNVTTSTSPTIHSLIVGGTVSFLGTVTFNFDTTYQTNPPPGFGTPGSMGVSMIVGSASSISRYPFGLVSSPLSDTV